MRFQFFQPWELFRKRNSLEEGLQGSSYVWEVTVEASLDVEKHEETPELEVRLRIKLPIKATGGSLFHLEGDGVDNSAYVLDSIDEEQSFIDIQGYIHQAEFLKNLIKGT